MGGGEGESVVTVFFTIPMAKHVACTFLLLVSDCIYTLIVS
jgi:hypothetical protein